jgi:hypothetical protein
MSEVDDLILISVDGQLIEPPDLFAHHLAARYRDRAPKLVRNDESKDVWTFGQVGDGEGGTQCRRRPTQGGRRGTEPSRRPCTPNMPCTPNIRAHPTSVHTQHEE